MDVGDGFKIFRNLNPAREAQDTASVARSQPEGGCALHLEAVSEPLPGFGRLRRA
jgi:hypothetical protein